MLAILSDVHANLEALTAVLADTARFPVTAIYCLGDVIGFGPNPRECCDIAGRFEVCLRGDHEELIDLHSRGSSPELDVGTRQMLHRTRAELFDTDDTTGNERRQTFLESLVPRRLVGNVLFVHASPRDPLDDYVFPEDAYNLQKITSLFSLFKRICFHGHTHLPGVFAQEANSEAIEFWAPTDDDSVFVVGTQKVLCNVGSVGQSRDGDPRACYVLFDEQTIRFRRVDYDMAATIKKIEGRPQG